MSELFDLIIIGGGPAGLSAGVYAARGKLKTLVIEGKRRTGGQCATTLELENYPGFPTSTGPDLMDQFHKHCEKFGVVFEKALISGISFEDEGFIKVVKTEDHQTFRGKTVVISTGAEPRILGIKGELEYRGKGVSYCATCDADFYEDLDIVVVGSGNTAVEESIYLTKFVNKITMIVIHNEGTLDADKLSQEEAFENDKIDFVWNSVVDEIYGDGLVEGVQLKNIKTGELTKLPTNGVFMFVGTTPRTSFVKDLLNLNPQGYIITDEKQETNIPGIFGAGDVTQKYLRQVVTAASDGSIAAVAANGYISEEEAWREKVTHNPGTAVVLFWSPLNEKSVECLRDIEEAIMGTKIKLVAMDSYKNKFMAERYGVVKIPTVVKFESGKEISRMVSPDKDDIKSLV